MPAALLRLPWLLALDRVPAGASPQDSSTGRRRATVGLGSSEL
jgi:hypothetical protein